MAWSNPTLLFGALLVGAPIVLHLIMRKQPRHLMFPALRFLRQRKEANQRRMRLRHLLLLLLRCAVIAAIAAALARPRVASNLVSNWLIVGTLGLALLGVAGARAGSGGAARWRPMAWVASVREPSRMTSPVRSNSLSAYAIPTSLRLSATRLQLLDIYASATQGGD